jgi:hypothetical protein
VANEVAVAMEAGAGTPLAEALRCLTVRVGDRERRHLISTGYLSLESRETAAYVAFALEAWIYDKCPLRWRPPPRRKPS